MGKTISDYSYRDSDQPCIKCYGKTKERLWTSSCESYDDYHFKCQNCGYSWWSESPDY